MLSFLFQLLPILPCAFLVFSPSFFFSRQNSAFLDRDLVMVPLGYCAEEDAIVMERMACSLDEKLAEESRLPPLRVLELALAAARPILHLHQHGVVHCDVKPDNFLFAEDGAGLSLSPFLPAPSSRAGQDHCVFLLPCRWQVG